MVVFDSGGKVVEEGWEQNGMFMENLTRIPHHGVAPMKVLIFSDIHGDMRALEKLVAQPADIYIAAGDLSTFRQRSRPLRRSLKPLGEQVWVLPGNHESHDDNARVLPERYGFVDFHRQIRR